MQNHNNLKGTNTKHSKIQTNKNLLHITRHKIRTYGCWASVIVGLTTWKSFPGKES